MSFEDYPNIKPEDYHNIFTEGFEANEKQNKQKVKAAIEKTIEHSECPGLCGVCALLSELELEEK